MYSHRGTRAIQRMVEFAPSSGGLALWVRHLDATADFASAPAVTDGHTVFYTPAFEKLSLPQQTGLVAHEVLHIALRHPQRHPQRFLDLQQLLGDADLTLYNICADAIVNSALSHLSWLSLPAAAVYLTGCCSMRSASNRTSKRRCSNGMSSACTARSTIATRTARSGAGPARTAGALRGSGR